MSQTIYAAYPDAHAAEKAVGALLDRGVLKDDITVVANHPGSTKEQEDAAHAVERAKTGVTTTTPGDTGKGLAEGAGIGLGLGVLAVLGSAVIPGLGLVLGGGALASSLTIAGAATAGGAIIGGVTGYLIDQGVPAHTANQYMSQIEAGGSLVEVHLPSGNVDLSEGQDILNKYGAAQINAY